MLSNYNFLDAVPILELLRIAIFMQFHHVAQFEVRALLQLRHFFAELR